MARMTAQDLLCLLSTFPHLLVPSEAAEFLGMLDSTADLLLLYQHYFPEEFRQATEQRVPFLSESGVSYSKLEVQFFELVNEHLFPLPLDWILGDPFDDRVHAYRIPVEPFGIDVDCSGYDELDLGWQLLFYLLGTLSEQELREYANFKEDALFRVPLVGKGEVSRSLLALRCQAQGGPIASLPWAIEMVHNETGTIWLDACMDEPIEDVFWVRQDVDELGKQYRQALDICEKAGTFCAWLEEDPVPRCALVARLLIACARDTPQRSSRPRTATVSAERFVEGINMGELFGRFIALPARRVED
jgi:hypothetical protein